MFKLYHSLFVCYLHITIVSVRSWSIYFLHSHVSLYSVSFINTGFGLFSIKIDLTRIRYVVAGDHLKDAGQGGPGTGLKYWIGRTLVILSKVRLPPEDPVHLSSLSET